MSLGQNFIPPSRAIYLPPLPYIPLLRKPLTVSRWFFHGFMGDLLDSCLFSVVVYVVSAKGTNNVLYDSRWSLANQSWKAKWSFLNVCPSVCPSVFKRFTFSFSLKLPVPTSTKLGTKRHFVKGSQFFSNEGSDPFFQ